MKKVWVVGLTVVMPVVGLCFLFGSCASIPACNNDACYDRQLASADPYRDGDIAAWGSERESAKRELEEAKKEYRFNRFSRER